MADYSRDIDDILIHSMDGTSQTIRGLSASTEKFNAAATEAFNRIRSTANKIDIDAFAPQSAPNDTLDVLDLYSGVGGWALGYRAVTFNNDARTLGIENDRDTVLAAAASGVPTVASDVAQVRQGMFKFQGLTASPPCQTFSIAGKSHGTKVVDQIKDAILAIQPGETVAEVLARIPGGDLVDDRSAQIIEPMRVALEAGDTLEWMCMENVPPTIGILGAYCHRLNLEGWSANAGVLNAADYGVPQNRLRAILVARRDGKLSTLPIRPPVKRRIIDVIPCLPEWELRPGSWADSPTSGRRRHTPDEQAPTLAFGKDTAGWQWVDPADPDQPLNVPVAHLGMLQGFPEDHSWHGSRSTQLTQVGNAIPPALAAAAIYEAIKP